MSQEPAQKAGGGLEEQARHRTATLKQVRQVTSTKRSLLMFGALRSLTSSSM